MNFLETDPCELENTAPSNGLSAPSNVNILKRQDIVTAGYVTTDDFGTDGDDTIHSAIPHFPYPNVFQANASFPKNGSLPDAVDVVLVDYIIPNVLAALTQNGGNYTTASFLPYLPGLISNQVLPIYASITPSWHPADGVCKSGEGVM